MKVDTELANVPAKEVRRDIFRTALAERLLRSLAPDRRQKHIFVDPHDHVGVRIAARGFYDGYRLAAVKRLVERHPALFRRAKARNLALDIGANIGNHSIFLSDIFDHVLAFEPVPALALAAQASLAFNSIQNVTVTNCGLSDHAGLAPISMQLGNSGGSSLHPDDSHVGGKTLNVALAEGDKILADKVGQDDVISFVKIDVEGHEAAALRGLRHILDEHLPTIWFEAHGRADVNKVMESLDGLSYDHLYLFGDPVELVGESMKGAITRLSRGMRIGLTKMQVVPDRAYLNLLASPVPLT